jgi:hypothetical protein
MVNYNCPRCNYETIIKTIYVRHLSRKFICSNIFSDDNLQKEYIKYNLYNKIKCSKKFHDGSEKALNCSKISKYQCNFCKKYYSRNSNLNKHIKKCKSKKIDDTEKDEILKLIDLLNKQLKEKDKQLEKRDKQIDELIKKHGFNTTNIKNIQNNNKINIKILGYNNTNTDLLSDTEIINCINHKNMCIPHIIKMLHFNPKYPENHNIYISNLKNGYIMVYNGGEWDTLNRDNIIDDIIDDKESLIENRILNWENNQDKYRTIVCKFKNYLEKKDNDIILNKIKNEIKLLLFNNKKLVKLITE